MTKYRHTYVLGQMAFTRASNRGIIRKIKINGKITYVREDFKCEKCKKIFTVDDIGKKVVSIGMVRNRRTYHMKCARKVKVI